MSNSLKIVVLGGGRVGNAIARDLDLDHAVTVVDVSDEILARLEGVGGIQTIKADLSSAETITDLVSKFDLVIGAVPGWMGYETLKTVIQAGKNIVDISFCEEDALTLDELAREKGVTAVVDCGVAPGLSNLVLGRLEEEFDSIEHFTCLVGGLPQKPVQPWEYKAPYSPVDVIEMYTRPARFRRDGETVTFQALTEPELINFSGVGALEAFNTDGLRTLLDTSKARNLSEKTLRYQGHMDKVKLLRDSGFFSDEPKKVGDQMVRPIDITSELLFEQWHQGPDDHDVTVMRLVVDGVRNGKKVRGQYDMVDRFDPEKGIPSMSRTTGYPCAAVARLVGAGAYNRVGISPPEFIGKDADCYNAVLKDLEARGVTFQHSESE